MTDVKNIIIGGIHNRLFEQNKNWLCVITGETGSGKSYSAMKLCEMIDSSFNIDRVIFSPKEFMKLINSEKLKKGNALVMDEAGLSLPSREWFSFNNRAINRILQSFRHRNLAVVFTVPSMSFIDSQARILFHCCVETVSVNYVKEFVQTKMFFMQYNSRMNKLYYKYPVEIRDGSRIQLRRINYYMPSNQLVKDYEVKKQAFTKELNKSLERDYDNMESKKLRTPVIVDIDEMIKKVIKNKKQFQGRDKRKKPYIDIALIQTEFNIGRVYAQQVKKGVEYKIKWDS